MSGLAAGGGSVVKDRVVISLREYMTDYGQRAPDKEEGNEELSASQSLRT